VLTLQPLLQHMVQQFLQVPWQQQRGPAGCCASFKESLWQVGHTMNMHTQVMTATQAVVKGIASTLSGKRPQLAATPAVNACSANKTRGHLAATVGNGL
jgi:hypothetical protein